MIKDKEMFLRTEEVEVKKEEAEVTIRVEEENSNMLILLELVVAYLMKMIINQKEVRALKSILTAVGVEFNIKSYNLLTLL